MTEPVRRDLWVAAGVDLRALALSDEAVAAYTFLELGLFETV
jgi:hypothetical protein